LLPQLAPQLEELPQWNKLINNGSSADNCQHKNGEEKPLENIAQGIVDVLSEICSTSEEPCTINVNSKSDSVLLEENVRAPHENFHPCQVCSGRLMTV